MTMRRVLLALLLAALAGAFLALDPGRYLNLDWLRAQQAALAAQYAAAPLATAAAYAALYVAVAALSLPGAAILTLAGGAIFGLVAGTLIVSFASTLGATLAFLIARFLLRDWVQTRFAHRLAAVNAGIERDGTFYLFALRLVPAVPFFAVNLLLALTPMRAWTFAWVSQLGMLAGTIVYVHAGSTLADFRLTPALVAAFALLGLFPLLARRALDTLAARRAWAGWPRPARFERDLVVIGGGAAGLVAAYIGATLKARVTLVERHRMGGDCLNTGCVPSKALIKTARVAHTLRHAARYGLTDLPVAVDFAQAMARVRAVVAAVAPHDSAERYRALGVDCVEGTAKITSPWTVEVRTPGVPPCSLSTRSIIIAAGARPAVPPVPGLDAVGCLTSDTVWSLPALPRRLLVLGGGAAGCELAQCFARLGAAVTLVEQQPRLLAGEDVEVSALLEQQFRSEGIAVMAAHRALRFAREGDEKVLYCEHAGGRVRIAVDEVLCAVGRVANTTGYGLEELGIATTAAGTVDVDAFMQTRYPNILACGDVAGPWQFTHTAAHAAWYAAINGLFGGLRRFRADFSVIPRAVFTDPEIARVGLSEAEARQRNRPCEVTTYGLDELDRALADGAAQGFVRVLTAPGSDRILGATIAGEHAGELITEFVTAMRHGIGLRRLLGTVHVYPTFAEANKHAAGVWQRAHAPQAALRWLARYHAWRRG